MDAPAPSPGSALAAEDSAFASSPRELVLVDASDVDESSFDDGVDALDPVDASSFDRAPSSPFRVVGSRKIQRRSNRLVFPDRSAHGEPGIARRRGAHRTQTDSSARRDRVSRLGRRSPTRASTTTWMRWRLTRARARAPAPARADVDRADADDARDGRVACVASSGRPPRRPNTAPSRTACAQL